VQNAQQVKEEETGMAKMYRTPLWQRLLNAFVKSLNSVAVAVGPFSLLTVQGRTSGKSHTLPVAPIERNGKRWLVSPNGAVNWVHNVRAAGMVTLTRGRLHERLAVRELAPQESAPILKEYVTRFSIVRSSFEVTPQSDLAAFVAEAPRHPVFALRELATPS